MSHYTCLVILRPGTAPIDTAVRDLLEPYDENTEVEPYEREDGTLSTYNPKSKWDWYEIGGRWSGELSTSGRDIFPLTDLVPGWSVYAIVTPDGEWHSKGRMGWFASSHDEDPQWDAERYEIASAFPDHTAVLVDLHI